MRLNQLSDNEGSRKLKKRVGRGIGSGMGKQSTRGGKGQTARAGSSINGFEGGQMPLHMRMPKRGFKMYGRLKFAEVTLARLQRAFDAGHFKSGEAVDAAKLVAAGVIKRSYDGIRVLAGGDLKAKANLTVAGITASARKSVEDAGGSITLLQLHKVYEPTSQRGKKRRAEGRAKKKAAAEE